MLPKLRQVSRCEPKPRKFVNKAKNDVDMPSQKRTFFNMGKEDAWGKPYFGAF